MHRKLTTQKDWSKLKTGLEFCRIPHFYTAELKTLNNARGFHTPVIIRTLNTKLLTHQALQEDRLHTNFFF